MVASRERTTRLDRLRDDRTRHRTDALVEVAALVTDFDLNVLGDGIDLVIKPPAEALDQMNDFVRTMHELSGLLTSSTPASPWATPRTRC